MPFGITTARRRIPAGLPAAVLAAVLAGLPSPLCAAEPDEPPPGEAPPGMAWVPGG
jgi:hypothetical protein